MIISVTEDDIKLGVAEHCSLCPVALAIRRNTECKVEVLYDKITFYPDRGRPRAVETPMVVRDFIRKFDGSLGPYEPFSFELDIPMKEY